MEPFLMISDYVTHFYLLSCEHSWTSLEIITLNFSYVETLYDIYFTYNEGSTSVYQATSTVFLPVC